MASTYFSIFDNNSCLSYSLESKNEKSWPFYQSNEHFYGRKCMEFEWLSGDNSLLIGILNTQKRVSFFGNFSKTRYEDIYNTNRQSNFSYIESFVLNERYMFCFDTFLQRAMLINKTYTFVFPYYCKTNDWSIIIQQGSATCSSSGIAWFDYPFQNIIPSGFYSLADPRTGECFTCQQSKYFLNNKLIYVFIALMS